MQIGTGGERRSQRRQARMVVGQGGGQIGQQRQRVAQTGEVARTCILQRDAAADAFDVGTAFEQLA